MQDDLLDFGAVEKRGGALALDDDAIVDDSEGRVGEPVAVELEQPAKESRHFAIGGQRHDRRDGAQESRVAAVALGDADQDGRAAALDGPGRERGGRGAAQLGRIEAQPHDDLFDELLAVSNCLATSSGDALMNPGPCEESPPRGPCVNAYRRPKREPFLRLRDLLRFGPPRRKFDEIKKRRVWPPSGRPMSAFSDGRREQ